MAGEPHKPGEWPIPESPPAKLAVLGPHAVLILTVGLASAAGIALTRESGRIASLWIANAVVLIALLKKPKKTWPHWLISGLIGNLAADLAMGDSSWTALALSLCNSIEIFIAGWLIVAWGGKRSLTLTQMKPLLKFIVAAGLVAPFLSGMLAALTLHISSNAPTWTVLWTWVPADSLGLLTIVPLFTQTAKEDFTKLLRWPSWLEASFLFILIPITTAIVFQGTHLPWIFALSPVLLWTAFRFDFAGVALAIFLMTLSGVCTIALDGKVPENLLAIRHQVSFLQVFVFVNVLISLSIANLRRTVKEQHERIKPLSDQIHHHEEEHEATLALLRILNTQTDTRELIHSVTAYFQQWLECDAVGIRLRHGEDFPYYETKGFPLDFVQAENRLCAVNPEGQIVRDHLGNPVLECMCGNVICGRFDTSKPFFTKFGTFWTNSTTTLLASTTEADRKARTRNRCHGEGYESVALIPLRLQGETLGLLQINDRRPDRFTPNRIALCEQLADTLAVSLAQRRAQDSLKESERRYRRITEGLTDYQYSVLVENGKPVKTIQGQGCAIVTGYAPEEYEKDPYLWIQMVAPEDRERIQNRVNQILSGLDVPPVEHRIRRKDGTLRWIRETTILFKDQNGLLTSYDGVLKDITERKQAEEQLRELSHRLQLATTSASLGIWDWDIPSDVMVWDDRMLELYGMALDDFRGCLDAWIQRLHPLDAPRVHEHLQAVFRGEGAYNIEFRISLPDGQIRHIKADGLVIRDASGQAIRMIGINRDITNQKRAEIALKASEEKFRAIVENTVDTILRINLEGRFTYVSPSITRLLPHHPQELIGKIPAETGFPEQAWSTGIRSVVETEQPYTTEFEHWNEGTSQILELRLFPEFDPNHKVASITGSVQNLTELRRSRRNYQLLFEQMMDGFAVHEIICNDLGKPVNYRFLAVNPAFEAMTGLSARNIIGKTVLEVLPETELSWIETYGHVALTGESIRFEQHSAALGKYFEVVAFQPNAGQFACVFLDITDRKSAEQQILRLNETLERRVQERTEELERAFQNLRKASSEIEDLYDRAPCGYHSLDSEGRFVKINQTELEWLGYNRDEVIGKLRILDVMSPDSRSEFAINFTQLKQHGTIQNIRTEMIRKDGSSFHALTNATVVRASDGSFLMTRSVMQDITDLDRIEKALKAQQSRLEATNRELEAFSYSVSHDLRAPLRGIDGFSQAILEDYGERLDEEGKHYLQRIRAGTQRMGQLINDLLDLSRITRGELNRCPMDLGSLVSNVVEELRRQQPERQVETRVQERCIGNADQHLMRVAVENLIRNAWKFTNQCSEAQIEFGQIDTDRGPAFFVKDNGAGFDMTYADKLFGAFQRLHTIEDYEGTGIGLAIVQRIIHRHGGEIWANATVGHGATFYFTLPS